MVTKINKKINEIERFVVKKIHQVCEILTKAYKEKLGSGSQIPHLSLFSFSLSS